MNQFTMTLDKPRTFRLTLAALVLGGAQLAALPADVAPQHRMAALCRIFLLADDPALSIADVERILTDYLRGDIWGFRKRRLMRLRTRLGGMLYVYKKNLGG